MDNIVLNRQEAQELVAHIEAAGFLESEPMYEMKRQISKFLENGATETIIIDIRYSKECK